MLKGADNFRKLEDQLEENGVIENFEKENGPILGRVMIDLGEIPNNLRSEVLKNHTEEEIYVFDCSFDFYDILIGMAIDKDTFEPVSKIWFTEQAENAEHPDEVWIKFFVEMLAENILSVIKAGEGFGIPVCILVNDDSELVAVPSA